jgi:hypothetical protein
LGGLKCRFQGVILGHLREDAPVDEETAREALGDAVALWEVRTTFGPEEVIAAATDALVIGVDSPTLRELAGASARDDYWTLRPLVDGALKELSIPLPAPGTDEIQIAATRVMAKRVINRGLTPSEFARWAHATIGHEGAHQLQPLVDLHDAWAVTEYTGDTLADLDEAARSMALSLLAGESLKQPSSVGLRRSAPKPTSDESRTRIRSVISQLRRTLRP